MLTLPLAACQDWCNSCADSTPPPYGPLAYVQTIVANKNHYVKAKNCAVQIGVRIVTVSSSSLLVAIGNQPTLRDMSTLKRYSALFPKLIQSLGPAAITCSAETNAITPWILQPTTESATISRVEYVRTFMSAHIVCIRTMWKL